MHLMIILSALFFFNCFGFAALFPRSYYRSENVIQFEETGDIDLLFKTEDQYLRSLAYVDLMYSHFLGVKSGNTMDLQQVTKIDLVLKKYFSRESAEFKELVFSKLFVYSVEQEEPLAAKTFFSKLSKTSLSGAICSSIENLAWPEFDERGKYKEAFSYNPSPLKVLIPFIVENNLENQFCIETDANEKKTPFSLLEILSMGGSEVYAEYARAVNAYKAKATNRNQNNSPLSGIQIQCKREILERNFADVIERIGNPKVGGQYYIYINQPHCLLQGIAKSVPGGFEFNMNYGVAGAVKLTLPFKNVSEIVGQLLKTPITAN